ncbi:MAG: hypothetical protein AB7O52_19260 [Planctomycetota bacterium]
MRASVSGGDFLHFLLLCAGLSLIAVALLWAPRRETTLALEARHASLAQAVTRERERAAEYHRLSRAFETDPHFRRVVLSWATRHRRPGVVTVEEYVRRESDSGSGRGSKPQS